MDIIDGHGQSKMDGANNRCDFLVVARSELQGKRTNLGKVYHTTNVVEHTWTARPSQEYPVFRLLWQSHVRGLGQVILAAAMDLFLQIQASRLFPRAMTLLCKRKKNDEDEGRVQLSESERSEEELEDEADFGTWGEESDSS